MSKSTAMQSPDPASAQPRGRRKASGVVVPHSLRWYARLGAWLVFLFVRTVSATLRYRWEDRSGFFDGKTPRPAIYCIWHNRLALCMTAYFGYVHKQSPTRGLAALVSASKDGAFLAAILENFGVQPVRGSSSRRGAQALLELTTSVEQGYDVAITPDGPRGPCYHVQDGVTSLAQVTGLPIVLLGFAPAAGNFHAPNEWMSLRVFEAGIRTMAAYWDELAGGG